ncbi:MAG: tetratricopeptide (TPR) repeat protein [Limisphaerales bacterium]|jgi:tetratricopeptide (TPR) repeat protein
MDQQQIEQIEAYLDGSMDSESSTAFEAQLKTNAALAAEVKLHKEIAAAIHNKEETAFKDMLFEIDQAHKQSPERQIENDFSSFELDKKKSGKIISMRRIMSLAAILVIMIGALYVLSLNSVSPEALAQANIENFIAPGALRGQTDQAKQDAQTGFKAFNDGEYAKANTLLSKALKSNPSHPDLLFFLGLSQLELGDGKAAVSSFDELGKLGSTAWSEDAEWHLLLSLVMSEEFEVASLLCNRIISANAKYTVDAEKLLPKIEKLNSKD